jgi:hypothetical protein
MHLWNAERLAFALRAGRLGEAEKAKYLIAGSLLSSLSAGPGLTAWRTTGGASRSAALLAVTVGGIWLCYLANRRGDGRAFVERFICLTVPVYVRWLVLYYAAWIALAIVGQAVGRPRLPATAFGEWYPLLMLPLFYALLHQYVSIAARPREDDVAPGTKEADG